LGLFFEKHLFEVLVFSFEKVKVFEQLFRKVLVFFGLFFENLDFSLKAGDLFFVLHGLGR
jgi:hypothetical protein